MKNRSTLWLAQIPNGLPREWTWVSAVRSRLGVCLELTWETQRRDVKLRVVNTWQFEGKCSRPHLACSYLWRFNFFKGISIWFIFNVASVFRRFRIVAKKRLLLSSCPSVLLHWSARLQLVEFSWNLMLETFMTIRRESHFFLKMGKEISDISRGNFSTFYCSRRPKTIIKFLFSIEILSGG